MKAGNDHVVPLCRQALALLEEIRPHSGAHQYVFPSTRSGSKHLPIGTPSLIQALRRIGFASTKAEADSFTTHGFRGLASTTLHQHPAFNAYKSEWIGIPSQGSRENLKNMPESLHEHALALHPSATSGRPRQDAVFGVGVV